MRKIIGIGESILDIIFEGNQPLKAVPGGSVFNAMISLGRCNLPVNFVSEVGNDRVGSILKSFIEENNISSDYLYTFNAGNSPVSLAFLDENHNASYSFYNKFPENRLDTAFPPIEDGDIVVFGSYFALNPVLRDRVQSFLEYAHGKNAFIYYDLNFRKPHAHEKIKLKTSLIENFEFADMIRCSEEDLSVLYPGQNVEEVYKNEIAYYTKNFIFTSGPGNVILKTETLSKSYTVPEITPVSTIGAGDNFNAGLVYGLYANNIFKSQIGRLTEEEWAQIIPHAIAFASEACMNHDNYISCEFAEKLKG